MSILVVIVRIYCYQFKSNYLKSHRLFDPFVLNFWYLHKIAKVLKKKKKKNEPRRSSISEVIDSERRAFLNA